MGIKDTIHHLPNFNEVFDRIALLPEKDLRDKWLKTGKKSLFHFNLKWYWSAIEDWACIDNSHGNRNFQIRLPFNEFKDDDRSAYWVLFAVVLANELRLGN